MSADLLWAVGDRTAMDSAIPRRGAPLCVLRAPWPTSTREGRWRGREAGKCVCGVRATGVCAVLPLAAGSAGSNLGRLSRERACRFGGGAGGGEAFRRRPLWRNLRAALARRSFVTLEWEIWDAGNYMAIGDLMAATCL